MPKSELERIKDLTVKFHYNVFVYTNIIDGTLLEILSLELTKEAHNIRKRIAFGDYFENFTFQEKIDFLKVILDTNHQGILKKFPDFFAELGDVKKWRDIIAHSPVAFIRDSNEENARLILSHRKIKKQKFLTERQMQGIIKKVKKCNSDTRKILSLIGKTKGLNY